MNNDDTQINTIFKTNLFSFDVMRERLPAKVFENLSRTIAEGGVLDTSTADVVANAMKDWAVEKGATHYCHWFQPLTGLTAEKHLSFLSSSEESGVFNEFSGKDLIQGEPDASSFPSGSLRENFEARGYTVWDYTSPAFIKEDGKNTTLFIPSAFCSYTGEALDHKTPLLRANEAVNRESIRVLRALGDTETKRVFVTLGAEQEYFLIERKYVPERLDLMETGRTLFGSRPPKNMAQSVHYFGAINEQVATFMAEVNMELWKLGIRAETQHHEISPSQFEISPIFSTANVANDQNQLIMQTLQKVAHRQGLECLLHEKPFSTLGGSGKHINWSLSSDRGLNLLEPGKTLYENKVFLVFLSAVIKAIDTYPELIRESVAGPGNDLRIGAMEAPPAIISIFLGDTLVNILNNVAEGVAESTELGEIRLGVKSLPSLPKDLSDRNRTSPLAFTGNRFEFRAGGSGLTISRPAISMSTAMADILHHFAEELEKADDIDTCVQQIVRRVMKENGKIIYNDDNYSYEWIQEAEKRNLPNLPDTVDALQAIDNDKCISLFDRQHVLSKDEYLARMDSAYAQFALDILIEARTAVTMVQRQIIPKTIEFSSCLAQAVKNVGEVGGDASVARHTVKEVCDLLTQLQAGIDRLTRAIEKAETIEDHREQAFYTRDHVKSEMQTIRETVDSLEMIVDSDVWPFPTYAHMIYGR